MIVPTARTATLAALAAPLALVVAAAVPGAWVLVPAAGMALLILVLLDGLMAGRLLNERNYETLGKLEAFADERGKTTLDLAIGWLASQPHVGSVIAGATRPEQVAQNVAAGEWKLNPDELAEVDAISRR